MQKLFNEYINNNVEYDFSFCKKYSSVCGYYVADTETTKIDNGNRVHFNKEKVRLQSELLADLGIEEDFSTDDVLESIKTNDVEVWCGMMSYVGRFSSSILNPKTFKHPSKKERGRMVLSNSITGLVNHLLNLPTLKSVVDFYNLDFDGVFILDELNRLGFKQNLNVIENSSRGDKIGNLFKDEDCDKYYSIMIKDRRIYEIKIKCNDKVIYIRDLMKSMGAFKLKDAVKDFTGIDTSMKNGDDGELDYNAYRKPLELLSEKELNYLKFDTLAFNILAFRIRVDLGINTLTIGSFAFKEMKKTWKERIEQYYTVGLVDDAPDYIYNETDYLDWTLNNQRDNMIKKAIEKGKALPSEEEVIKSSVSRVIKNLLLPEYTRDFESVLKESYRGGHTYKNHELYQEILIKLNKVKLYSKAIDKISKGLGFSFDANSLYPTTMYETVFKNVFGKSTTYYFPYGKGKKFYGDYRKNEDWLSGKYKTGFVRLRIIDFDIKRYKNGNHHVPLLRKNGVSYIDNKQYLLSSHFDKGDIEIEGWYSIVDFEYLEKHYHMKYNITQSYLFKGTKDLFKDFIGKFYEMKQNGEGVFRSFAKLILNSSYGKLGQSHIKKVENFCFDDGKIKVKIEKDEDGLDIQVFESGHHNMAIASYITSLARMRKLMIENYLIEKGFNPVYGDTDSLYIVCLSFKQMKECYKTLEQTGWIDTSDSGAIGLWKGEKIFNEFNFVATKKYYTHCIEFNPKKDKKTGIKPYDNININILSENELESYLKEYGKDKYICCGLGSKDTIKYPKCFALAENSKSIKKLYSNGELYTNVDKNKNGIIDPHIYEDKEMTKAVIGAFITNKKENVKGGIVIKPHIYIMTPKNK